MNKKLPLYLIGVIMLVFGSCKKDSSMPPPTNTITGNYNFVSLSAKITSTTQLSQSGIVLKTVTVSDYMTINNGGTIRISADSLVATGLAYTVDTTVMIYDYENNALVDSLPYPIYANIPSANSASKYKLITNDSIYYYGGGLIDLALGGSSSTPTKASSGKYVLSGNILTLTTHVNQHYTDNSSGTPITVVNIGIATTILQKQ